MSGKLITRMAGSAFTPLCLAVAACFIVLSGCSTAHYKESADRETYRIIQQKATDVPGMDPNFTIKPIDISSFEGLPQVEEVEKALGDDAQEELGGYIISLEKALELAVKHSRTYQNRKETLFLQALRLSLERHNFTPIFGADASTSYGRETRDVTTLSTTDRFAQAAPQLVRNIGLLTGTPAALITQYQNLVADAVAVSQAGEGSVDIVNERYWDGSTHIGVDRLLKGGGRIAIDLSSDFLRFLTGNPRVSTSSALVSSFTQPLLQGRKSAAAERLTQAERDTLYALRDFARFRKTFAVDIARSYYGVLSNRDTARNNFASLQAFQTSTNRDRAMVTEGRKAVSDLGRTQQAELQAENRWISSVQRYKQSMDNFKIQLGLPVDTNFVLDEGELERLQDKGIQNYNITRDDAIKIALHSRLDLYNTRDELEDAARYVEVQANQLQPGLDLMLTSRVNSKPGDRFQELDFQRARWNAGVDLDLPLDRKAERNAYRTALIDLERADRELELQVDNVKLQIRNAIRNLEEQRKTYEINLLGVQINADRVEEQRLNSELGRGRSQDLVDAQNDLTSAQNQLTSSLIDYTVSRLEFWRDMGILFIKENGHWEEVNDQIESTAVDTSRIEAMELSVEASAPEAAESEMPAEAPGAEAGMMDPEMPEAEALEAEAGMMNSESPAAPEAEAGMMNSETPAAAPEAEAGMMNSETRAAEPGAEAAESAEGETSEEEAPEPEGESPADV